MGLPFIIESMVLADRINPEIIRDILADKLLQKHENVCLSKLMN